MPKNKFNIDDVVTINTQNDDGSPLVGQVYSIEKAFDTYWYGLIVNPNSRISYTIKQVPEKNIMSFEDAYAIASA